MPQSATTPDHLPDFARLAAELRPRLHRYCARLMGSVLDGEDVVQEALMKASFSFEADGVQNPEAWLFRVAHNAAMDLLRRRARDQALFTDEEGLESVPAADGGVDRVDTTALALRIFMRLPPAQRSAVILADVLEHPLDECAAVMGVSLASAKAALHRGRVRLRELAPLAEQAAPQRLSAQDQQLLAEYVQRFNARDFDGLRGMLAEHVRLDLVGRRREDGRAVVSMYYGNYARVQGLRSEPGVVEGRPALWVYEDGATEPGYFIVLGGAPDRVEEIRDFRYARYAMESVAR